MVYVGEFKDNKKDGKGKYIYKDDSHYDGEFIDDLFDGNGKYFWNDGKKYKGLFKNGLINWKGEFIWNDNSIYVGEYINNIKQFENNEPNGNGYFEYNNKRYNEIFDNGKLLSNDKSILSKNKIKFGKKEIIINSNVNMNDIL